MSSRGPCVKGLVTKVVLLGGVLPSLRCLGEWGDYESLPLYLLFSLVLRWVVFVLSNVLPHQRPKAMGLINPALEPAKWQGKINPFQVIYLRYFITVTKSWPMIFPSPVWPLVYTAAFGPATYECIFLRAIPLFRFSGSTCPTNYSALKTFKVGLSTQLPSPKCVWVGILPDISLVPLMLPSYYLRSLSVCGISLYVNLGGVFLNEINT